MRRTIDSRAGAPGRRRPLLRPGGFLGLFLVCLVGFAGGCTDEVAPKGRPGAVAEAGVAGPPAALAYVGSERCADCHAQEAEAWRGSDHDHAMDTNLEARLLGAFDGRTLRDGAVTWRFYRKEQGPWIERKAEDGSIDAFPVTATFGVRPLQQVLVARPDGRRQALPVAWGAHPDTSESAGWFALQPGQTHVPDDPLHWDGLAFNWNSQCAACHSTALEKRFEDRTGRFETRFAEEDVGCEACHGPGSLHVARLEAPREASAAVDPGLPVRFASWDPAAWQRTEGEAIARRVRPRAHDQQMDSCAPCHSRRSELVPRPEPGAPFLDGYGPRLLGADLYFEDGQIEDEVYVWGSFASSRMHEAGVRCSDCHDPHSGGLRAEGDALCLGCHAPDRYAASPHGGHAEAIDTDCIDCHMPTRTYMQVDVRRDHAFGLPRPLRSAALGSPDACGSCHADASPASLARAIAETRGDAPKPPHWADRLVAAGKARPEADRWLDVLDDPRGSDWVRGSAWQRYAAEVQRLPDPAVVLKRRAEAGPLERLGFVELARRFPPDARRTLLAPLLRDPLRAIRIEAAEALHAGGAAELGPADRSALAEALQEYRVAQQANAERPEAQVNLGLLSLRNGDPVAARRAYEKALARAPYFVPARVNLADLARAEGRDEEALAQLARAVEDVPEDGFVRYAYGLALHRTGDRAGALSALERAASLAPHDAQTRLGHALALDGLGRREEAIEAIGQAIEAGVISPSLFEAQVSFLAGIGEVARATAQAERWRSLYPDDPRPGRLLERLASPTR